MKKPLVIISACQFTRLALESLIPADRYIVRVYSNVTTEVEFVLKTSCGYLLADIPSLPSGELVLLACLVRLRSDAGQWQVCLTGVTNGAIVIHTQRLKSDPGGNLLS